MNIHELLEDLNELLESTNKVPGIRNKVFVDNERLTNFANKMKRSISDNIETPLGVRASNNSTTLGNPLVISRPATPPV